MLRVAIKQQEDNKKVRRNQQEKVVVKQDEVSIKATLTMLYARALFSFTLVLLFSLQSGRIVKEERKKR